VTCNFNAARWFLYRKLILDDRSLLYPERRKVANKIDNMGADHFQKTGCDCWAKVTGEVEVNEDVKGEGK
jgi:hypothetical protein